jgi:hypothetical protein
MTPLATPHPCRLLHADIAAGVAARFAPKRSQDQAVDGANNRRLYNQLKPCGSWQRIMDAGTNKQKRNQQLSIFELEALREAFRQSVRENDVAEAEWAQHAELFVKKTSQKGDRLTRA